ncbi:MAG: transposase zinc-binding domain-containing protein, partial [Lentisphaeria bacterium]|nr:transposase zinc-binding domain-containing protein [Lentisphaeria bacterium]
MAAILAAHWWEFVEHYQRWIRPVAFEDVRKVLACRTAALGCHVYICPECGHVEVKPRSCKSRFCPTCGKHAADVWADQVPSRLLDVPHHHLVLSIPWQRWRFRSRSTNQAR